MSGQWAHRGAARGA